MTTQEGSYGFSGNVYTRWVDDGRYMELTRSLHYIDKNGKQWTAPAGLIIDGASIPRAFWRTIGGPYEGKYRRASVIHDAYCYTHSEKCDDVHAVFLEMMLADGVESWRAKAMYWAVKTFTRW